ncbi:MULTISPECIES: HNH endonuclease [unclassified Pseudomonas]|uniref:HNH endonuclease n=1 Tax=unclassified Pseudomonas TaxID=196821 RepID=UPI000D87385E|nr:MULTISPECIES: HNH endonuclease [unclassified Pseudomonas]PYG79884.1 HNH endonuclease [Pseudomonas sp. RV120224-01c]PYG83612.1 HNH endonuclease [Pseudomonas sp. RV120224-01b]
MPLADFLRSQTVNSVELTFAQIDELVGGLPPVARNHNAWWANSRTDDSHTWAHLWIEAGWERKSLDLSAEVVVFERHSREQEISGFWWVNHKQTYQAELEGGYIWSPTKNKNGARNQTYINLTLVRAGDVVISYAGGQIRAIGVATSVYTEQTKPEAFGQAGQNWSDTGWLVPIEWTVLDKAVLPKDHITAISSLLPAKNSPLQANGNGNQGCYLASISPELGSFILRLSNSAGSAIIERVHELEDQVRADEAEREIQLNQELAATEREQLVRSRVGQGTFRLQVLDREKSCRLTGVSDKRFLIASHIKPWKDCSNLERLDGNNGLMLAPHVDKLFDRGWITFLDDGELLVADPAKEVVSAWGLASGMNVGDFTVEQRGYLSYHRSEVYKGKLQ